MKAIFALVAIIQALDCVHATGTRGCLADNCARQITGTSRGLEVQSSRRADCSSYFQPVITPPVVTETRTETVTSATTTCATETTTDNTVTVPSGTVTTTITPPVVYRRQLASVKPDYASNCPNFSAYSSACSCWGVTPYTITLPTPTEYVWVTESSTACVTATEKETKTENIPASTETVKVCPAGYTKCGDKCVNVLTNKDNCGACGVKCAISCTNGRCNACSEEPSRCGLANQCGDKKTCACVLTTEGNTACVTSNNCMGRECESSSECSGTQVCVVRVCCKVGKNDVEKKICMPQGAACPKALLSSKRDILNTLRMRDMEDPPAEFDPSFVPDSEPISPAEI